MEKIVSFRQLVAWQKAMNLAETCYSISGELPRGEEYVLGAQLRRAGISVPSNIAEGQRLTTNGFRAHLRTSLASEAEIETQVELGNRLGLIGAHRAETAVAQAEEVARLLRGLMASLTRS
jgi:four helix bundle protein